LTTLATLTTLTSCYQPELPAQLACGDAGSCPSGRACSLGACVPLAQLRGFHVLALDPADGAEEVSIRSPIGVTLSAPVAVGATLEGGVVLSGPDGSAVAGSTSVDATRTQLTFTPAATLAREARHAVLVQGLRDEAGRELALARTSFSTRGKDWSAPTLLETGAGAVSRPSIGITSAGVPRVAWLQDEGGVAHLFTTRLQGGGWEVPRRIDGGTGPVTAYRLAVGTVGDTTLFWVQDDAGVASLWESHHQAVPDSWTAPLLIEHSAVPVTDLALAMAGATPVAVWLQGTEVWWITRSPGSASFGMPVLLEGAPGAVGRPRISATGTRAVAVWERRGAPTEVHGARWLLIAPFQAAERIDSGSGPAFEGVVGVGPDVDVVLWLEGVGSATRLIGRRRDPDVPWSDATVQTLAPQSAARQSSAPVLALGPDKSALALWQEQLGAQVDLVAAYAPADAPFQAAQTLDATPSGTAVPASVAFAGSEAIAVYSRVGAAQVDLWARRFSAATGWSAAEAIDAGAGQVIAGAHGVASNGQLSFVVFAQSPAGGGPADLLATQYP
ncbi:MAG: Ig-like domain-containing protein, partial [Deltaproteobacteria bacterium]|nr:Ig-like domain-containing protein [Deltaproteobacteria bacterium]